MEQDHFFSSLRKNSFLHNKPLGSYVVVPLSN
jgi:hypothetical protein